MTKTLYAKCMIFISAIFVSSLVVFSTQAPVTAATYQCGGGPVVKTSIDLGCTGHGNPIADMTFAFIRLLSDGVGIVIVASMIVGGIQFTTSRDDPEAKKHAISRIQTSLVALLIFIFAYAILNFVIPGGFFNNSSSSTSSLLPSTDNVVNSLDHIGINQLAGINYV
jgi:hypothetical protein